MLFISYYRLIIESHKIKLNNTNMWLKNTLSLGSNLFVAGVWWSWRNDNSFCFSNAFIFYYRLIMEARNITLIFISCISSSLRDKNIDGSNGIPSIHASFLMLIASCLGNRVKVGCYGLLHHPSVIWISSFSGFLSETFNILHA